MSDLGEEVGIALREKRISIMPIIEKVAKRKNLVHNHFWETYVNTLCPPKICRFSLLYWLYI